MCDGTQVTLRCLQWILVKRNRSVNTGGDWYVRMGKRSQDSYKPVLERKFIEKRKGECV